MSDSKCKGCEKLGRYIWLDEDDYCFHCSKNIRLKIGKLFLNE
jgi:hypothetical protein